MSTSFAFLLVASLVGQQSDLPPFFNEINNTLASYYKSPDPNLGPQLLKKLLKKENLQHPWFVDHDGDLQLTGVPLGYIAAGNPKIVRAYESELVGAPLAGRRVILRALMNCGDMETVKQAATWLADRRYADMRQELAALKKHLEDPKRKRARDQPASQLEDLYQLWADFFITGEYAPVSRILDVFDLPDPKDNADLKYTASWFLVAILEEHPKLVELVQKNAKDRPQRSREVIERYILTQPLDGKVEVGRWESQDGDREPLVFEKNGRFKCGFIKEKGEWVMATGRYTIQADGNIQTEATSDGSTLARTFTWKDGVISGSRGPNPKVKWKKVKQ